MCHNGAMSKDEPKREDAPPAWIGALVEAIASKLMNKPPEPDQQIMDPAIRRMQAVIDAENERGQIIETLVPMQSQASVYMYDGVPYYASFVAAIQRGKVIALRDYAEPEEIWRHTSEGGICTLGRDEMFKPNCERKAVHATDKMKRWAYETFYLVDARFYVGKPLPRHMRPAPASPAVDVAAE